MMNIWMKQGVVHNGRVTRAPYPLTVSDSYGKFLVERGDATYDLNQDLPEEGRTAADPFGLNGASARRADAILAAYAGKTGATNENVLEKLFVDLRHWADRHGQSVEEAVAKSRDVYREEVENNHGN